MNNVQSIYDQVRAHPKLIIAEDFELVVQLASSQSVRYRNGRAAARGQEDQCWIGLRVLHRKRAGRSSGFITVGDSVDALIRRAFDAAENAGADPWFRLPLWKPQRGNEPAKNVELKVEDPIFPSLVLVSSLVEEHYKQTNLETAIFRKYDKASLAYRKQLYQLRFRVAENGEPAPICFEEVRSSDRPLGSRQVWLSQLLARLFSRRATPPMAYQPKDSSHLLFSPQAGAFLLGQLSPWFFADGGVEVSPLARRVGERFGSTALTVIDDGRLPLGAFSLPFDLEGTPTQRTTLVEKGEIRSYLFDSYTAARENRLSTGNFHRRLDEAAPRLNSTNLFFEAGGSSAEDLAKAVHEGLFLEALDSLEWVPGTVAMCHLTGEGWYLSSQGNAVPLPRLRLTLDVMDLLERAVSTGNDLNFYNGVGAPSILFENVPLRN